MRTLLLVTTLFNCLICSSQSPMYERLERLIDEPANFQEVETLMGENHVSYRFATNRLFQPWSGLFVVNYPDLHTSITLNVRTGRRSDPSKLFVLSAVLFDEKIAEGLLTDSLVAANP